MAVKDIYVKQDLDTGHIVLAAVAEPGPPVSPTDYAMLEFKFDPAGSGLEELILQAINTTGPNDQFLKMDLVAKLLELLNNGIGLKLSNPSAKVTLPTSNPNASYTTSYGQRRDHNLQELVGTLAIAAKGKFSGNANSGTVDMDVTYDAPTQITTIWADGVAPDSSILLSNCQSGSTTGSLYTNLRQQSEDGVSNDSYLEIKGMNSGDQFSAAVINSSDIMRGETGDATTPGTLDIFEVDGSNWRVAMSGLTDEHLLFVTMLDDEATGKNHYVNFTKGAVGDPDMIDGQFNIFFSSSIGTGNHPKFSVVAFKEGGDSNPRAIAIKSDKFGDGPEDLTTPTLFEGGWGYGTAGNNQFVVKHAAIKGGSGSEAATRIFFTMTDDDLSSGTIYVSSVADGEVRIQTSNVSYQPTMNILIMN